jgi:nucleotide-binding universal stress UspA family protein
MIVGIAADQDVAVVQQAAAFAEKFDTELVCVWVDEPLPIMSGTEYAAFALPTQIDAEVGAQPTMPEELLSMLDEALHERPVRWSTRVLTGLPADELARLAEELDALMVVVGTREATAAAAVAEFFTGSVAVQLSHRQHRPVLVIPRNPVPPDQPLPWLPA